jgi:hypothetical protein
MELSILLTELPQQIRHGLTIDLEYNHPKLLPALDFHYMIVSIKWEGQGAGSICQAGEIKTKRVVL